MSKLIQKIEIPISLLSLLFVCLLSPDTSYATVQSDTIPPVITQASIDQVVSCDTGIEEALQNWFDRSAGIQAEDESSEVTLQSTISATEALRLLDDNREISCGETGAVSVGFFAQDSCLNSSDTSFALFEIIDTTGPIFLQLPADLTIQCDASRTDSLNQWIRSFGGAAIEDNCDMILTFDSYRFSINGAEEQQGSFDNDLEIDPAECAFAVDVTFVAIDDCGNASEASALFMLIDTIAPVFLETLVDTVRVNCDNIPSARSVNVSDDCNGTLAPIISDVSTQDPDPNTCEHFNFRVNRTFTATDLCGNAVTMEQIILVSDTLEPRFVAPPDIVLSNTSDISPEVTGFPIDIIDNCSSEVIIDFTDNRSTNACEVVIDRRWNIQDLCGSSLVLSQNIIVRDSIAPIIVRPPMDIIVDCNDEIDLASGFEEWVESRGSAIVRDEMGEIVQDFAAVPGSYDINDSSTWPGTDPEDFDLISCPSTVQGLTRFEQVDFVYVDNCGNALVIQGTYGVGDDMAPEIITTINDTTIVIDDTENCTASITLSSLEVSDNCTLETPILFNSGIVDIEGDNPDLPVEALQLAFGPIPEEDIGTSQNIELIIDLFNVDANNPSEYFEVLSESGMILGRTNNTVAQCGDGRTVISIPRQDVIDEISQDGIYTITLTPNIVAGVPTLSINPVCNNAQASGILNIGSRSDMNINVSIIVDQSIDTSFNVSDQVNIGVGDHEILYIATDCAGNSDSLLQLVSVTDTSSSVEIFCPEDLMINSDQGRCSAEVELEISDFDSGCSDVVSVDSIGIAGSSPRVIINPTSPLTLTLSVGNNDLTYFYDNGQECDQRITIRDREFPQILCAAELPLIIDPSGVVPIELDTSAIITSISDNCGIREIEIRVPEIGCEDIGSSIPIAINVSDLAGNRTTCNSNFIVTAFDLQPTVNPILCIGDTIRLFANAPTIAGSTQLQYQWTGPDGFSSNEENPVIANSTLNAAGRYNLTVNGQNGCSTSGTIDLIIQDFTAPDISVEAESVCLGDSIMVSTTQFTSDVVYTWHEGVFPNGAIIQSGASSELRITPTLGIHEYYVIIASNDCGLTFDPSSPVSISVVERPLFSIEVDSIELCFGDTLRLTGSSNEQDVDLGWIGPNGFTANSRTTGIAGVTQEEAGTYTLLASRMQCIDSLSVELNVLDSVITPIILGDNQFCRSARAILEIANVIEGSAPQQYDWFRNGVFAERTTTPQLAIESVNQETVGLWTVTMDNGQCVSAQSAPHEISLIDNLDIVIDAETSVCQGDSVRLFVPAVNGAIYNWSGPSNFTSSVQNPVAPSVPGIYAVDISTNTGCSATASIDIDIVERPVILTVLADLQDCTDGTISTLLFSSVSSEEGIIYDWTGPNGFRSSEPIPSLENYTSADNGVYRLSISRGSCVSEPDSIIVDVRDIPDIPLLIDDINSCESDSLRIIATPIEGLVDQYIWTTPVGIISTQDATLSLPELSQDDAGQYFVAAELDGCLSDNSDTIALSVFANPGIPDLIVEPLCEGEDIVLRVDRQNNTLYEWIGPNGFSSDEARITLDPDDNPDVRNFGLRIIQNGCPSPFIFAGTLPIGVQPPVPRVTTMDQDICPDGQLSIELCVDPSSISERSTINWINMTTELEIGSTDSMCFILTTTDRLIVGSNTIVAQILNDGCPSNFSAPIEINVFEVPEVVARAGEDEIVCTSNDEFIAAIEPLRGVGTWTSEDPAISFSDINNHETRVSGLSRGENRLLWSLSNGPCENFSVDDKIVTLQELVIANEDMLQVDMDRETTLDVLANDEMVPSNFILDIIEQPQVGEISVDPDNQEVSYIPSTQLARELSFSYEICSGLCLDNCDQAIVTLTPESRAGCFAPTVITPNADGINDEFVIPCINTGSFVNNELIVYNEWGDEVHYAQPYDNTWQGTRNGESLPSGTYYYVFRLDNDQEATRGFLVIQR
jgi:gliding motility-associated-like protein